MTDCITSRVLEWLASCEIFGTPSVDALSSDEGWAIFPQGCREVSRRRDILGGQKRTLRYHYRIKMHLRRDPRESDDRGAAILDALNNRAGEITWCKAWVENARLAAQTGTMARYDAELYIEQ